MNADDFNQFIINQISDIIDHEKNINLNNFSYDLLSDLDDELSNPNAIVFTNMINKFFNDNNVLDDEGNILVVEIPRNLSTRVKSTGNKGVIYLSIAEDRWIRADELYGNRTFSKFGIKYGVI